MLLQFFEEGLLHTLAPLPHALRPIGRHRGHHRAGAQC